MYICNFIASQVIEQLLDMALETEALVLAGR